MGPPVSNETKRNESAANWPNARDAPRVPFPGCVWYCSRQARCKTPPDAPRRATRTIGPGDGTFSLRAANMDVAAAQKRIDAITWYHEFDFGSGLKSRPKRPGLHRGIWNFIEGQLAEVDFRGKTVLDIGCWDGYWSFYAERRGAASVLATDDRTQNWSKNEGIHVAKDLMGSKVEINQDMSVYELS